MKNLTTKILFLLFITSSCSDGVRVEGYIDRSGENLKMAQAWIDNLLINDLDAVRDLMHEDFSFMYMGLTENEDGVYGKGGISYNKDAFFSDYWPVVGELLPNGISLKTTEVIAGRNGVALVQEGDAEGINGEYDNKYVWIFQIRERLIYSVREYNSDLLVGTRLYKNKLVEEK